MCGIIGYLGTDNAKDQILEGLRKIEYRGYDSSGIAVITQGGAISVAKTKGGIDELNPVSASLPEAAVGIGHTRWATHGEPSQANAHPHSSENFTLVHNGIIENYQQLLDKMNQKEPVDRVSQTDSEVLVHLIERNYQKSNDAKKAILTALKSVQGTFGVAILNHGDPDVLYIARRSSPIVIAQTETGYMVASDITALPEHTKHVTYLKDDQLAAISDDGMRISDLEDKQVKFDTEELDVAQVEVNKEGNAHFMLKEILEQPTSVSETLRGRLDRKRHTAVLGGLDMSAAQAKRFDSILAVACGTATHSALLSSYVLEDIVDIPLRSEPASEFLYRKHFMKPEKVLGMAISQSGETADTIAAINKLNLLGVRTHGVVNAIGSNISRITDGGTYLHCGPEIAVASTKAFTSMVVTQMLIGIKLNELRGRPVKNNRRAVEALKNLPDALALTIEQTHEASKNMASELADIEKAMFLGRTKLFPVALEGALKFKEITYIPAEGHPAGEMKHGPLALVDESMLVVYLVREDELFDKSVSNLREIQARHGKILVITDSERLANESENSILVPKADSLISPLLFNIPLQFLAYYVALERELSIDKPRNLAKSVTVE